MIDLPSHTRTEVCKLSDWLQARSQPDGKADQIKPQSGHVQDWPSTQKTDSSQIPSSNGLPALAALVLRQPSLNLT